MTESVAMKRYGISRGQLAQIGKEVATIWHVLDVPGFIGDRHRQPMGHFPELYGNVFRGVGP